MFKKEFLKQSEIHAEIVKNSSKKGNALYQDAVMTAFFKKIKGRNGLAAFFCENQISEYNYKYSSLTKMFADYKLKKN